MLRKLFKQPVVLASTIIALALLAFPFAAAAQGIPMLNVTGGPKGQQQYSLSLQLLALMTSLTLLPSFLLMMTAFVRIIIVLSILRQALGTGQTPPNTVLVGLALFLTLFIMSPILNDIYTNALVPYMQKGMAFDKALAAAEEPLRNFMMKQTREDDIGLFMQMANKGEPVNAAAVPFSTLVPAFITSELKSAFTIGFLIYIPFVVIDLIVASVLMSMGMMMLSPMMISMPFKLMLFVLVDGWSLILVLISAPLLGVALFVGLFIGILQAATSINEATLSFIPKLAALAITLAVVGGWQLTTLVDYTRALFQRIPGLFT